jgi:hypothetical protein
MEKILVGVYRDFQVGLRSVKRDTCIALVAVSTLALGIVAATVVFGIVDNVLLAPFPYKNLNRLTTIYEHRSNRLADHDSLSAEEFVDFEEQNHSFDDLVPQAAGAQGVDRALFAMADFATIKKLALDFALLGASVHENEGETCSLTGAARFDRDHVLVVFGTYFQFGDRAGAVTFAFELS